MKILYAARVARYDFQRAINALVCRVHRWNAECEDDLYRLMCYAKSSLSRRQYAWVGNHASEITPHLFADADFAGSPDTARSTNGVHLYFKGSRKYFLSVVPARSRIAYPTQPRKPKSWLPLSLSGEKVYHRSTCGITSCRTTPPRTSMTTPARSLLFMRTTRP